MLNPKLLTLASQYLKSTRPRSTAAHGSRVTAILGFLEVAPEVVEQTPLIELADNWFEMGTDLSDQSQLTCAAQLRQLLTGSTNPEEAVVQTDE